MQKIAGERFYPAPLLLGLAGAGSFFSRPQPPYRRLLCENEETNPDGSGDAGGFRGKKLTPEEQLQQELDQVYAMEVAEQRLGGLACRPGDLRRGGHCYGGGHRGRSFMQKKIDAHHYPASSITKLVTTLAALKKWQSAGSCDLFPQPAFLFLNGMRRPIGMKEGNQLTLGAGSLRLTLLASCK